ncbi:MAG: arsenosugar biosynthesis radical SAM protein ArsS [Deltaproteobacteria bacterium]|nr:arsenosugar biosynthesis radical SAM protein ArsS [Deltaproteobacteria bacterium]
MNAKVIPFEETIRKHGIELTRKPLEILQINVGKLCNQACLHCHVEAGPKRTEIMEKRTVDRLLDLLSLSPDIHTVDLTGGAPELIPSFRYLVTECRRLGKEVIDRCNLTVLFEKGQETTAQFLRDERVRIVASLPCYSKDNVDKQRGNGVFGKSIRALNLLNELGYGKEGTGLGLDLVYNPLGAFLPPDQVELEREFKEELKNLFGIEFNRLYTITNMPIKRFLRDLERSGKLQEYMELLVSSFNVQAALGVMCLNLLSVSWDGQLYDCDFNQMLEIPIFWKKRTIWEVESLEELTRAPIAVADHCYGCTAGDGSSCSGALI